VIDDTIIKGTLKKINFTEWAWSIPIKSGIVLFKNGPEIKSLDSLFLKYKTLPPAQQQNAKPEVNMVVSLWKPFFPQVVYAYVIEAIKEVIIPGSATNIILSLKSFEDHPNIRNKPKKLIATGPKVILLTGFVPGNPFAIGNETVWSTDLLDDVKIVMGSWLERAWLERACLY